MDGHGEAFEADVGKGHDALVVRVNDPDQRLSGLGESVTTRTLIARRDHLAPKFFDPGAAFGLVRGAR